MGKFAVKDKTEIRAEIKAAAGVKRKRRRISNKAILIIKLITVCVLLFGCCLFFFDQRRLFLKDIMQLETLNFTWTFFFPFIFFGGIVFIIVYISRLITQFESKELWKADRLYILFQFVCTVLLVTVALRCFLDTMSANRFVLGIMMIAGVVTLLTPQIKDNDNSDF